MTNTVSVAMATYNGAKYIKEQLESLAAQTVLPAELVVTDDGSTDATIQLIEAFSARAPFPVRIHKNSNRLGYRENFFNAAALCTSDIIAFCDQDDVWHADKIEVCLGKFASADTMLTFHNAIVTKENLEPIDSLAWTATPRDVNPPLSTNPYIFGYGFTICVRKTFFLLRDLWQLSSDFNSDKHKEAHDQWAFFLAGVFGTIVFLRQNLAHYRRHESAVTFQQGKELSGLSLLRDKILKYLRSDTDVWHARARCFTQRAEILAQIALHHSGEFSKEAAERGKNYYAMYARFYQDRTEMYKAGSMRKRFALFCRIYAQGSTLCIYNKKKLAVKDFALGVLGLSFVG